MSTITSTKRENNRPNRTAFWASLDTSSFDRTMRFDTTSNTMSGGDQVE
jgi:hypothetical protein